ncbi:MAG: hypothetical protein JWM91_1641, partial [Rhodospirillales bacterium]|nr:hypothetical protein [Rhodospirillales bacterium]
MTPAQLAKVLEVSERTIYPNIAELAAQSALIQ